MSRFTRKAILAISGQAGTIIVSVIALRAVLDAFGYSERWIVEALGVIVLVRMGYYLTRGPRPLLTSYVIRKRIWRLVVDETKITMGFIAMIFLMDWPLSHLPVAVFAGVNLVGQALILLFWSRVFKKLAHHMHRSENRMFERRVVIIGTGERAKQVADMIVESPELETKLVGFLDFHRPGLWRYRDIPLLGRPRGLRKIIADSQVDAVFIAVEPEELPRTREVFAIAEEMGVPVCLMPNIYEPRVSTVRPMYINGLPALVYRAVPDHQVWLTLKSTVDRIGAAVGILLTAPIMLVTAILIKLDSHGPILYSQTRCGLNGKPFKLYKFRTMHNGADDRKIDLLHKNEMSGPVFKIKEDPRVTGIGRTLRKFSIDELPQFFNVFKGEMSLVGPRPPLPHEASGFEPWQRRKLSVKPGVTCLWQVNGRNRIDFDDWMKLDLQYIDNWSLWLDARIIARTFPTVMKGTGV